MLDPSTLPIVKGKYRQNATLAPVTWFGVGGEADILFKPEDVEDLAHFLKNCPKHIPLTIFGVASNLLIRDGGIEGIVIRLGRHFASITHDDEAQTLTAGAASLDVNVAKYALNNKLSGLEFLIGIPGTIGGALYMNAGAYGSEIKDSLLWAEAIDQKGQIHHFTNKELSFSYRHSIAHDKQLFFTKACFQVTPLADTKPIQERMEYITTSRESTQPIRSKTGGSTFRNPDGHKAWELIDKVGARGYRRGGAKFSDLHCNFIVNDQNASAADIETLGDEIRQKVLDQTGIQLEWEIKRIGKKDKHQ